MTKEADVRDLNPWWKNPDNIRADTKIQEWEKSNIRHDPGLRHAIQYDFKPDNTVVYTLRGPRQVGKTTLIKLQIRDFLENGVHPWNIVYYSLDLANAQQDVVDVVEIYLKLSDRQRGNRRFYIFLDEASSVTDWQKGIKWLVDGGKLANCTVVVTGSHAVNIKNSTERLPGRKGTVDGSHDKIMLPMKFAEYAFMLNGDIRDTAEAAGLHLPENRASIFEGLLTGEVDGRLDKLYGYQNEINDLLVEYMITGGTPKIINEKIASNTIRENTYASYLEGITGQWAGLAKNETLLKQFGGAIIKSLSSHTSWSNLAKEAALGSPNTAADYAYALRDLFVLSMVHRYGERKKIPMIQDDRKFYFRDPVFLHIFNGWMSPNDSFDTSLRYLEAESNRGNVVEGIVGDHLVRLAFDRSTKKQTFDYSNHVFYWRDDKGREVDFILHDGAGAEVPIEVKFRSSLRYRELAPVTSFLDKTGSRTGLILSKSELGARPDYVIIPASVFLLLV